MKNIHNTKTNVHDDAGHFAGMPKLINKKAVATMLNCSVRQVDYLRANEGLPHVLIGSLVKFDPAEILKWLKRKEVNPVE